MSNHNANVDIRGNLRVRGRIEGNLRVSDEVEAAAFYIRGVGEVAAGVTDHGALTGLSDDDHTQYLLASGSRAMAGDLDMDGNNIIGAGLVFSTEEYTAGIGSPSTPSYGFQNVDTGMYGVEGGRDIGFSSEGVERAVIGRDGMRVNDKIKAEAFYLVSGGEFSVDKTTIRSEAIDKDEVSYTDPAEIYVGDDGIVYAYDPTRNKNLSVGRTILPFGRAGVTVTNNQWLNAYGNIGANGVHFAAAAMPRNYTLVSLTGTAADVSSDEVEIQLQKINTDAVTTNLGEVLTFYIAASLTYPVKRQTFMDIDFDRDEGFAFIVLTSGTINNPRVVAEIAWRDDS